MTQPVVYVALSQFCEQDEKPRKILQDAGFILKENKTGKRLKKEELIEVLQGVDAVLAGVEPYDVDLFSKLPNLKLISRLGAGLDSVDLEAAGRHDIRVMATPDEVVEPVAQMTLAMMLALIRCFPVFGGDFQKGLWKKQTGFLLSELHVGLIGFGRIARRVYDYLKPFGCPVRVFDPFVKADDLPQGVLGCDLESLLALSDIVSLHLNRPAKEGPLLGACEFAKMKRGSFLVNTARGHFLDETALQEVLAGGHLAGAALDVFAEEPCNGPLTRLSNVLSTPHVATLTRGSRIAMEIRCAQNVVDYFSNKHR